MREIRFRGKRIDNGEWVEGYLVCDRKFWGEPDFHAYIVAHEHPSGCFGSDIYIEVDPSTVCQYTGLTDKNGKRIFEGDIIRTERNGGRTYFVLFDDDLCAFIGSVCESNIFTTFEGDGDRYEVIGNVHDNPELVKEEPT